MEEGVLRVVKVLKEGGGETVEGLKRRLGESGMDDLAFLILVKTLVQLWAVEVVVDNVA